MTRPTSRSALRSAAAALSVLVALTDCAGGPTEPREPLANTVAMRQLVAGTLTAGGSTEYAISVPRDSTVFISFWARSGSAADTLVATLRAAAGGGALATLRSAGSQGALHDLMVTLGAAPIDRDLVVTVAGAGPSHSGAYQLLLRPMSAQPERAIASVTAGMTIAEAIDAPGDVDEFELPGSAGHIAWLQVVAEVPFANGLQVELVDGATVLSSVSTTATQSSLGELETEWVAFPRSGSYTIRVRGGDAGAGGGTGAYLVRAYSIPPAPLPDPRSLLRREAVIDTLAGNDSVSTWLMGYTQQTPMGFSLEVLSAAPGDTLTATFHTTASTDPLGSISAVASAGDTVFALPITLGASGPAIIATVRGSRRGITAVYRVRWGAPLSDLPETAPHSIVPGDTIHESLDDPHDLDRFLLTSDPDSDWVVMLAPTLDGRPPMGIRVHDRDHRIVAQWGVSGVRSELEYSATRLTLGDRGPYTLTIGDSFILPVGALGDYRMRVLRVDRGTESGPARVAAGDVFQGTVDDVGDVDEFQFDAVEGQEVYFHLRPGTAVEQVFTLLDGEESITKAPLPGMVLPLQEQNIHHRWTAPRTGTFTVRLENGAVAGPRTNWPASYEFEIQEVRREPESASPTGWTFGDTIQGEAIERRGDVDEFEMSFDSTTMTRLEFRATRVASTDAVYLSVSDSIGQWVANLSVGGGTLGDSIAAAAHVEFFPGRYRFMVEGTGLNPVPYRFLTVPSYLGPETIGDTLPVGVWVSGEAIDSIGDADRFVYPVVAGVTYVGEIEGLPGSTGGFWLISDAAYASSDSTRGIRAATETAWIHAVVQQFPGILGPTSGPYRLRITAVDPAPETAAAVIAIGDSVAAEAIDGFGDVDTFTFTGAAGDALRLVARSAAFDAGARLSAQVRAAGGGEIATINLDATSVDFTLPEAGEYRVVISARLLVQTRDLGPYLMALVRR